MRIIDLCEVSLRNLFRHKAFFLVFLLLTVATTANLFGISFYTSTVNYWDKYVQKNINFRIFNLSYHDSVTVEDALRLAEKNEHVLGATDSHGYLANMLIPEYATASFNSSFYLFGVPPKNLIPIEQGENLDSYSADEKVMICPQKFYPTVDTRNYDTDHFIDLSDKVGKKVKLQFSIYDEYTEYKIVGLYDTLENYSHGTMCYTSYQNVKNLNRFFEAKNPLPPNNNEIESLYFMIDDVNNAEVVQKHLRDHQLFGEPSSIIDMSLANKTLKATFYITLFSLVISIIIVTIVLLQNMEARKKEFFLYQVLGYRRKDVKKLLLFENLMLGVFSYLFSFLLFFIITPVFRTEFLTNKALFYQLNIELSIFASGVGLFVSFFIPIIITLFLSSSLKKKELQF